MSSPCCHIGTHVCSFIPPYMLEHIANARHLAEADQDCAHQTLTSTRQFLSTRSSGRAHQHPSGRSGIVPGFMLRNLATSQESDEQTKLDASGTLDQAAAAKASKADRQLKANREVHDARHSADYDKLPGVLVTSDAKPAVASIEHTVIDCFQNLGAVYKFYADIFGRDSIDDKGLPLIGSVHFGKNYENAFWDGTQMVFGDGGTFLTNFTNSLDVVGHELTHGVTESTANLVYHGQPGALNESISDVFGSCIRQYRFKESAADADWLIGEDCILPDIRGLALRSMRAPGTAYDDPRIGKDPQPAHMRDFKVMSDDEEGDNGGVHHNSGIPNHAFYLVATGLGGNSWEKAGPIWYHTVTGKEITNKCDFKTFAEITCSVAKSKFDEDVEKVVRGAWVEVGVLE